MESALATLVLMIAGFFSVITLADTYFTTQDQLWQAKTLMEARIEDANTTALAVVQSEVNGATGTQVTFTLRNVGSTKVADFDQWDLIIQHYSAAGIYSVQWLPYTSDLSLANNQWRVAGFYLSAAEDIPEVFEPGILNPGEELVIQAQVYPPIGPSTVNLATVMSNNGYRQSLLFER